MKAAETLQRQVAEGKVPQWWAAAMGAGFFGKPSDDLRAPPTARLFRGGDSLLARLGVDVKLAGDGLIYPLSKSGNPQGLSLNLDPKNPFIQKYGGAFPVDSVPKGLQIQQSGQPGHFVISPAAPMTFEIYQQLLNQVQLGNFNVIR